MLNTILKYISISTVFVFFIWLFASVLYFTEPITIPKQLYLPKGSISKTIQALNDVTNNSFFETDRYILSFFGMPQHGWIELPSTEMSRIDILYQTTVAKATNVSISLIPGETTYIFLQQVAKKFDLNFDKLFEKFNEKADLKEGFLIPETYHFPKKVTEEYVVSHLIKFARQTHKKYMKLFRISDLQEWKKLIIIGSIIEKETAGKKEMPLISSVIYNRLKKNMKLQMDGTLNYGKYSRLKVTAQRIREDESKYNTYKYAGIPYMPVCNPSLEAIRSAIFPAETNYLYFVKNRSTGEHLFTHSYSQHVKNIKNQ